MLIDVIIPVYNGAKYIPAFFAMMAPQAAPDVRLLFIDDGSTDGSAGLIEAYAARYAVPARVVRQENAGASAARNRGLREADAAYAAFFDIDDLAAPDYIPCLRGMAMRGGFDVLVFGGRRVPEAEAAAKSAAPEPTDIPKPTDTPEQTSTPEPYTRTGEEQLRLFAADPTRLGVYHILVRRDFLTAQGLLFAEGYKYYEDYDFLYRLFARAERVSCLDRALYTYVMRPDSVMSRFTADRVSCLALMRELEADMAIHAPGFAAEFRRWGAARLYWSVLWQAALASPSYRAFRRYAAGTYADVYLRMLRIFPDRRVRLSGAVFRVSRRAYYAAVRLAAGGSARVQTLTEPELLAAAAGCPDPRRVLAYGMTDNPGGIESYLMGLYNRLPAGAMDFLCDFPAIAYADELAAKNADVYFIPAKSRSLFGHWRGTARVLRAHPEYRTVYVNALDAGCVFLAVVPWLMGRRVVVHSHNGDTDKRTLHRLCKPFLNALAAGRVSCSDAAAAHMFGDRPSLFIPNAIDAKSYRFDAAVRASVRASLGLGDRLAVCHVGRLSTQKNPLGLLDIFAAVRARRPDAVLLSVGEGEMAAAFDDRIHTLGLDGAVLRLGRRSDVPAILQAADVFVLPSYYEGLSIALLEAQAAGLGCVVSDTISPQTVITPLVRSLPLADGPDAWADAVLVAADTARTDTTALIREAGFDAARCEESDAALLAMLLPPPGGA